MRHGDQSGRFLTKTETHQKGNNNAERRKTVVNSYSDYDGYGGQRRLQVSAMRGDATKVEVVECIEDDPASSMIQASPAHLVAGFQAASDQRRTFWKCWFLRPVVRPMLYGSNPNEELQFGSGFDEFWEERLLVCSHLTK
ncbi:hypothetical protein Rs2_16945 [Raphanus sativus]|nr:hypothetical protein Rs2_16945 [Raphanus sativus]